MDMKQLAQEVFGQFKSLLEKRLQPFADRLKAIEDRPLPLNGKDGRDGIDGKDGAPGEPGGRGDIGPVGEKGAPGERGEQGPQGEKGEPGPQGPAGEPGPAGATGEKGERGEQGEKGLDGAPGERGEKGAPGELGPRGEKGEDGLAGRDGLEGAPGKDALQIEVFQSIDPARKYQRGAYASHKGGLVRSFRATDPLGDDLAKAGWEVIVRGIDSIEVELGDDLRTVTVKHSLSDGQVISKTFKTPNVIDRGIFKDGGEYAACDGVTFGGSFWIARKDSPQGKPGDAEDWRLAVKKGRDGKDAREEPRAPEVVRLS